MICNSRMPHSFLLNFAAKFPVSKGKVQACGVLQSRTAKKETKCGKEKKKEKKGGE